MSDKVSDVFALEHAQEIPENIVATSCAKCSLLLSLPLSVDKFYSNSDQ